MRQLGDIFLDDVDLADYEAEFSEIGEAESVSMDPNQRPMHEVVFEGLENAGIPSEKLDNQPVGCYTGSYAADYADMKNRDPEDRPANNALDVGRAILANHMSHFLNIKVPSVTLDTACSGSLQGLDLTCRYLQSGDINAAIVVTSNLYMSPEHLMDQGSVGSAHSVNPTFGELLLASFPSQELYTAEAVSTVIVKRLEDAIRDRDPVRGVVLGTATNSNGRTAGIVSPSCLPGHGYPSGTKSNAGHSEPSAGISGLLKVVLSIENDVIPGTPTFINPNPKSTCDIKKEDS
ncbi:MAG: hypothetical protein Q9184_004809 [Pyrenodesmia sp. 2 TL-2023]